MFNSMMQYQKFMHENPNASREEIGKAFEKSFLRVPIEEYKADIRKRYS